MKPNRELEQWLDETVKQPTEDEVKDMLKSLKKSGAIPKRDWKSEWEEEMPF